MTNLSASDVAGLRIREARKTKNWRVRDLADHCAKAGFPHITATVITNLETRRRASREITVDELLAIAHVLGVPPLQLITPLSAGEQLEVVPGVRLDTLEAPAWIADDDAMRGPVRTAASFRPEDTERVLRWRTSPLTLVRQIRAIAAAVERAQRELADEGFRARYPHTAERNKDGITVLGIRLLHLLASLEAMEYEPPPLTGVMEILREHGVPASLAEGQEQADSEGYDDES